MLFGRRAELLPPQSKLGIQGTKEGGQDRLLTSSRSCIAVRRPGRQRLSGCWVQGCTFLERECCQDSTHRLQG